MRYLANVVFPTPRGPERVITSPSKQLIEIFNILGNENILVTEGRKKLSSMLFS